MSFKFINIDEEGFPLFNGLRVHDQEFGKELIEGIDFLNDRKIFTCNYKNDKYIVEAFDLPFIAHQVDFSEDKLHIVLPYEVKKECFKDKFYFDPWDRLSGVTKEGIPFRMTKKAQDAFFNLVDEIYLDRYEINGHSYFFSSEFKENASIGAAQFWNEKYTSKSERPGWDLQTHHPALDSLLNQIKLPKSRILVLGCGRGHDCSYLAQRGHVVTGVDFSSSAIEDAKKLYANSGQIYFYQHDVFNLPEKFYGQFDIIFEHTLFCAIDPKKRHNLIQVWKNCLTDQGYLLGIFFTLYSPEGPPYGGTEWEYRERLKNQFQLLYWTRLRAQSQRSLGSELVVYSKKISK